MKVAPEHPWGLSVRVSASIADFVLTTRAIFKPAWSMPVAAIAGSRRSAAGERTQSRLQRRVGQSSRRRPAGRAMRRHGKRCLPALCEEGKVRSDHAIGGSVE